MGNFIDRTKEIVISSINTKKFLVNDEKLLRELGNIINEVIRCFSEGKKVLFCGNGGSAADAQHLAAELSGRFYKDRPGLDSEALHVNTSYITAVANDYSFDDIFLRSVKTKCKTGDVIFGLSTSGNSNNEINAIKEANKMGVTTIGFTGSKGGELYEICNFCIRVPSDDVARIQESHIMLGHILCQIVEE